MIKTYYLSKIIHKTHIPSFKKCSIDRTARVASGASLAKVRMGRYSYIGGNTHITDAEIGNFCSIGANSGIGGGIHPMQTVSTSPAFLKGRNILGVHFAEIPYEPSSTIVIENDVWIGEGVYIKPGVRIGNGAVVGAHAVVTKNVEPYTIVVGVPATMIRKRFDDETIDEFQRIKWWDWPEERLEQYGKYFSSPEALIEILKKEKEGQK